MNNHDHPLYYEHYRWEDYNISNILKNKIKKILENIPSDVETIIDIGCGNGLITNFLADKYKIIGVDRSKNALKHVEKEKLLCSSDYLCVKKSSFDLVFSSELLEHLENKTFQKTIDEIKRVCKNYIFLTVPNNEFIEKDFIKCPSCGNVFNKIYHLRNINLDKIKDLFPEFNVVSNFNYGTGKRGYNKFLHKIKHEFSPASAWIPNYWTKNSPRKSMCPKCETDFYFPYRFNLIGFLCDTLNMLFSPHKPYWMFVLLKNKKE